LVGGDRVLVAEVDKVVVAFNFYDELLGKPSVRSNTINLDWLDLPRLDLRELTYRFTEDELAYRFTSPGPDGFMTHLLHVAWLVIRGDIMHVFDALWHHDTRSLHNINQALLVILPMSPEACTIKDLG
jgi:hypothetical protein